MKLQKIGGIASLGLSFFVVIIFATYIFMLPRLGLITPEDWHDPVKAFNAWSASPATFYITFLAFLLTALAFIPVMMAIRERMQTDAPNLIRIAVIGVSIGCALWLLWALIGIIGLPLVIRTSDASAYRAVEALFQCAGSAGEHALGWALLLIGWAALKTRTLPRMLSYLCVFKGVVMILKIAVTVFGAVGLILGIVLYPWLGIVLLRTKN